jgi:hypothetical protein
MVAAAVSAVRQPATAAAALAAALRAAAQARQRAAGVQQLLRAVHPPHDQPCLWRCAEPCAFIEGLLVVMMERLCNPCNVHEICLVSGDERGQYTSRVLQ